MRTFVHLCLWVSFFQSIQQVTSERSTNKSGNNGKSDHALTDIPPRGWNSYDSFCWNINENEFLQNAQLVSKRLAPHGYQYVVVDFLWYRRKDMPRASTNSAGTDAIDEWGRVIPDPSRWPSAKNGKGFTQVADQVHQMGLKFGIHVMKGLSFQVYNQNTPILDTIKGGSYQEGGRVWTVKDIGLPDKACGWMNQGFMAVNTKLGAGKAFLRSLYHQYAEWGVDFVKHDCVFGDDFDMDEISYVSELLGNYGRPIVYSISPGSNANPELGKKVSGVVSMYRVSADDWDKWEHVVSHFDISRDFAAANMIGLNGTWPDLDMLPLGWLSEADSNEGPHRQCELTIDEQKTQVTLWSIAKSPLIFGGDMRKLDDTTYGLITHPVLLEINSYTVFNSEFSFVTGSPASLRSSSHQQPQAGGVDIRAWIAYGRSNEIYLAFFNLSSQRMVISAKSSDVVHRKKLSEIVCRGKEVWSGQDIGVLGETISKEVEPHGTSLFVIVCSYE